MLLLCVALLGCSDGQQSATRPALRTVQMKVGTGNFTLEVADSDSTREHGLMKRDSLPEDRGMIFVFEEEDQRAFWMKNTRIPLDIIYVDAVGKVVSIHQMKPYDLTSTPSAGPAMYAIELNWGMAAKCGIKPGDVVEIPASAREPSTARS